MSWADRFSYYRYKGLSRFAEIVWDNVWNNEAGRVLWLELPHHNEDTFIISGIRFMREFKLSIFFSIGKDKMTEIVT